MSAPYIDNLGFHALGLQGWIDLITPQYQSLFGTDKDLSANTRDGQWIRLLAGRFNLLESLLEQVYQGRSPDRAVGAGLARLVQLTGIAKKSAQYSSVPVTLAGTANTVVPAGSLIGDATDANKPAFATATDVAIGADGSGLGIAQCTVAGPIHVAAGNLTKIQSFVTGWATVTNPVDATPGMNVEADPILRGRRAKSAAIPSQSMLDGLEAALANLPGVIDAKVYENRTGVTDSNGLPPHSINAIVRGGADAQIANAIWTKASMGVTQAGRIAFDVVDGQGQPQTQRWDVASEIDVHIVIQLDRTPPAGVQSAVANAIVAYFAIDGDLPALIGQNVAQESLYTPINALALTGRPGLPSVTDVFIGSAPSPTSRADLIVPYNAVAVFDASRIRVVGP